MHFQVGSHSIWGQVSAQRYDNKNNYAMWIALLRIFDIENTLREFNMMKLVYIKSR